MSVQLLVVAIILIACFFLYFDVRRRVKRHRQSIADEKSEIAEETRMTAQLAVFSAPNDGSYVIGASEEMGAFYYRLMVKAMAVSRIKINLANILSVDLLINGSVYDKDVESPQTTMTNRATEEQSMILSNFPPEIVRSIHTLALRIVFRSDSGEDRVLPLNLYTDKDARQKATCVSVLKNSIWWWRYLRAILIQARRLQTLIDGSDAAKED